VTVGTTLFEALIEAVTTETALQWMTSNGYKQLIIQYGKGKKPSVVNQSGRPNIECYDFKPSLLPDMKRADLIVSHAGAGTVMEVLQLHHQDDTVTKAKRLVVVINSILMDNHQTELAEAMGKRKHLFVVESPKQLESTSTWDQLEDFQPIPKQPGDPLHFKIIMDEFLGVSEGPNKKIK